MLKFKTISENKNLYCDVNFLKQENGISLYEFSCHFPEKIHPKTVTVSFNIEYGEAFSIWNYSCAQNRALLSEWRENLQKTKSRLTFGLPVHSVITQNGVNVFTLSVSDIKNSLEISSGINEFSAGHNCIIRFFTQLTEKIDEYKAIIRVDERKINFAEAETDKEIITVCYSRNIMEISGKTHYIINGSGEDYIVLRADQYCDIKYEITDCMGEVITSEEKGLKGLLMLNVPESGFLKINTNK